MSLIRTRWAAVGAAVAVTLGGGGIGLVSATNPSNATAFVPITPCRVVDTRPQPEFNIGDSASPLGPEEARTITAVGTSGDCTEVPANASAVSLNITALNATMPTFLAVFAADATQPDASSLNPQPGAPPTPNAVTTELSKSGAFTIFNKQGTVDVIADINGYYVGHNHDGRYYTRSEVDSLIPDRFGTVVVDESAFTTMDASDEIERGLTTGGAYLKLVSAGNDGIIASVQVPDGARLTGMTAYSFDGSPQGGDNLNIVLRAMRLEAGFYETIAEVTTFGSGGLTTDSTGMSHVVDLSKNAYQILVTGAIRNDLRIRAVAVTYEMAP